MRAIFLLLLAVTVCLPLSAQEGNEQRRANHYVDHLILAVNDLDKGMAEFERLSGVKPRKDGSDPVLGTLSAIVGLGQNRFLEILAPDPEVNPDNLDPELRSFFYDRLQLMDELTPFRWAIGTGNLERTTNIMRRASNRPTEIMNASRKRGWGRKHVWRWVMVRVPETPVSPLFVQWGEESKRPQDRAPEGCSLEMLRMNSRNFSSMHTLLAATQIDIDFNGSEHDSLAYELDCPAGNVVFDHVSLTEIYSRPARKHRD